MKTQDVLYWSSTALAALAFAAGGLFDLSGAPAVASTLAQLGYPAYLATLLGAWKVLGAIAIVAPRAARIKEWAYAGMFFDLTGAAVSHLAVGDPAGKVLTPLVILGLVLASWALRPASRKVQTAEGEGRPLSQPAHAAA
jgi:hypothetical protein